jgi:hypothetical protein
MYKTRNLNPVNWMSRELSSIEGDDVCGLGTINRVIRFLRSDFSREWPERVSDTLLQQLADHISDETLRRRFVKSVSDLRKRPLPGERRMVLLPLIDGQDGAVCRLQLKREGQAYRTAGDGLPDFFDIRLDNSLKSSKDGIESACSAVFSILETPHPLQWGRWHLSIVHRQNPHDFPQVIDRSLGLAVSLLLLCWLTGRDLPGWTAATGVVEKGRVREVKGIDLKIRAVFREFPDIPLVLVPKENQIEKHRLPGLNEWQIARIHPVESLSEASELLFGAQPQALPLSPDFRQEDPEDVLFQAEKSQNNYQFQSAFLLSARAIEYYRLMDNQGWQASGKLFKAWQINLAAAKNLRNTKAAWKAFLASDKEKQRHFNRHLRQIKKADEYAYQVHLAVFLFDIFQFQTCERTLLAIEPENEAMALAQQKGLLGQLYTYMPGRRAEAGQYLTAAVEEGPLLESPRNQRYLGQWYLQCARFEIDKPKKEQLVKKANQSFLASLAAIRRLPKSHPVNEVFSRYGMAKTLYLEQDYERCIASAEETLTRFHDCLQENNVYPHPMLVKLKGLSHRHLGDFRSAELYLMQCVEILVSFTEGRESDYPVIRLMMLEPLLVLSMLENRQACRRKAASILSDFSRFLDHDYARGCPLPEISVENPFHPITLELERPAPDLNRCLSCLQTFYPYAC